MEVYHDNQIISLTAEKQTYSYSFIINHPTDNQARFGFDLGASAFDVYFDNIRVNSGTFVNIPETPAIPKSIQLFQNYPNPFNPSTIIKYELIVNSMVKLTVYDLSGRKIKELVNQQQGPGLHSVNFDASDLASGIYLYRLKTGSFEQSRKMLLLR